MSKGHKGKTYSQFISWEQVCHLFTLHLKECGKSNQNNRLRLKILDTIFLHQNHDGFTTIGQWYFTSKKGDVTKRKDPDRLTLQHLHDRFCRFSLANSSNAAGPRIVGIGYLETKCDKETIPQTIGLQKKRVHFTEEQLKRQIFHDNTGLTKCIYLQPYLRPHDGRDKFYRGSFRLFVESKEKGREKSCYNNENVNARIQSEVLVQVIEDHPSTGDLNSYVSRSGVKSCEGSSLMRWIQVEVETSTLKVVKYIESVVGMDLSFLNKDGVASQRVVALTADFTLDDNQQLWMASVDNVAVCNSDSLLVSQIQNISIHCIDDNYDAEENSEHPKIILPPVSSAQDETLNSHDEPNIISSMHGNKNDGEKMRWNESFENSSRTKDRGDDHGVALINAKVSLNATFMRGK